MKWVKLVGAEPIMTVNLGTRGIDEARNIIEYCNFKGGGYWSDLRIKHGVNEPYGIKTWCLGNELEGEWQVARKTADEYGLLANEAGKAMRLVDPEIKLVAVGSSTGNMPTFPKWDETVLMYTYEQADYLSLHNYIDKKDKDTETYLAMPIDMERQIQEIIATCDYVKAMKKSKKTMYLSFDEWNIHKEPDVKYVPWNTGCPLDWCRFNMEDTLVFGSMLLNILRNADRIKIACQSLLVNTIPLILTEKSGKAWRNPTFYPMLHASLYGRGEVLFNVIDTPKYNNEEYGEVPIVDSVTILNEEKSEMTVFAINRGDEAVHLNIDSRDFKRFSLIGHIELKSENLKVVNTSENPYKIKPELCDNTKINNSCAGSVLDSYSWNVIRFSVV